MDTTIDKYNAALETVKKWVADGCSEKERICLESVFPELRESEDERIRRAIIKSIEEDSSVYEQEVTKEQMLAYLEKQKEQTKEYPHSVIENAISFLTERNDGMPKDEARNIVNAVISVIKPEHWPRYRVQQPAEWSDEDEKLLNYAISMTDDAQVKRFLKSLRPQPHWKPSEEQMEALKSAVKLYKDTHFEIHHDKIVSLYEQLKKL